MPHAKLSQFITRSSLWREPEYVRCVFIAFLANKDESGYVEGSYKWMKGEANLTNDENGEKFADAIKRLESPDPQSKNKEFDGRRIIPIEGGWIVTGHDKYRLREDEQREQTRLRVAKFRENLKNSTKNNNVTPCNVTSENVTLPPVSVSVSISDNFNKSEVSEKDKRLESRQPWKLKCKTLPDYQKWEEEEYQKIIHNEKWLRERKEFHPRLDILQTIKKAHIDFWSKMAGWYNIKKRRGDSVDWESTWSNALSMKCNQVWDNTDQKEKTHQESLERLQRARREKGFIE